MIIIIRGPKKYLNTPKKSLNWPQHWNVWKVVGQGHISSLFGTFAGIVLSHVAPEHPVEPCVNHVQ